MRTTIRSGLVAGGLDAKLVDELLDAYDEAKRNFHLGGLRLNAVEGGRFCEAVFRLMQQTAFSRFDRLGKQLDTQRLIRDLEAATGKPDSIRLHIPRALRVVYDVRSKRDAVHLADGIDPSLQDATMVVSMLDWVMAELVRLYHDVEPDEAQQMVESLVTRSVPVVQDFDGFLKVLRPDLSARDHCLVLLYQRGAQGVSFEELRAWARPAMRANLKRTLDALEHERAYVHSIGAVYKITRAGEREVEDRRLLEPEK